MTAQYSPNVTDDKAALRPSGPYAEVESLLKLRFIGRELSLFNHKPAKTMMTGSVRTRFRGRGMEFEEVRHYQPGDDVRNIDWRVTARTQVPHTKLFREERERPVYVVVDQRQSMFFGSVNCFKSVLASHVAATLGWTALNQGDRIGGLVFGNREQTDIRPRRSKHAQMALINALIDTNKLLHKPDQQMQPQNLDTMLADVRRIAHPGCAVFFISDFHDISPETERLCYQLSRHTDLSLINIYDPLENHLPDQAGTLSISNGRDTVTLQANDQRVRTAHFERFAARQQALNQIAQHLKIQCLSFSTENDPNLILNRQFGRR